MTPGLDSRAKMVFEEALEKSGAERAAYLHEACGGDAELRARVERLLAGAEAEDAFLAGGSKGASDSSAGAAWVAAHVEKPGTVIGLYTLRELVGEGGFGSVFLAEQERPVKRRVALKIIKLGMDTRAVVARFEQERQALAVMDHPNIAKVLDAGATAAGRPYFVMEFVEGRPITRYCDERRLSVLARIELFVQVCAAVQHAHTKGIIHRDLKPSNVLVCEQDGKAVVKVIDFGIAKAVNRTLTDRTIFTEQRQLVGTPEYMSPEQAEGSRDLDTRTDVYSLGVVLYELLAGSPPFDPKDLHSAAYGELQRIIREVEPAKPSTRVQSSVTLANVAAQRATEPARLTTLLRGEIDWIIMRALEKDRLRRYESASALGADLARYLKGEAVEAAPPSQVYLAKKFVRRNRGPVVAAGLVVLAMTLGTVGTSVGLVRAREAEKAAGEEAAAAKASEARAKDAEKRAEQEAVAAKQNASIAVSVNELMTGMIERADRGKEDGRANVTVREVMDAAAKELLQNPQAYEPRVTAKLAHTIGETYQELSLLDQAEPMFRLAAETEKAVYGEVSLEYAAAVNRLGGLLKLMGKVETAAEHYAKALELAAKLGDEGTELRLNVLNNQSALARTLGKPDEAERLLVEAKTTLERTQQDKTELYASTMQNLAAIYYSQGKFDAADDAFQKSLAVRRVLPTSKPDDMLVALQNLAALQSQRGQNAAAEGTIREAIEKIRGLYGEENLRLSEALKMMSVIQSRRGDLDAALKSQRESVAIASKLLAADSPEFGFLQADLGSALLLAERWSEAEEVLTKASATLLKAFGSNHSEVAYTHYRLALALEHRGAFAEAEETLLKVKDVTGENMKEGARYEWIPHAVSSLLGSAQLGVGKVAEAKVLIPRAAESLMRLSATLGPKSRATIVGAAIDRCVALYEKLGESEPGAAAELKAWQTRRAEFLAAVKAPEAGR